MLLKLKSRGRDLTRVNNMSNRVSKKWVVKNSFKGDPKREDLEIVEEELPPLKDGGIYFIKH